MRTQGYLKQLTLYKVHFFELHWWKMHSDLYFNRRLTSSYISENPGFDVRKLSLNQPLKDWTVLWYSRKPYFLFIFATTGVLSFCQSLQAIIVNVPGWCGPPRCKPDGSFEEVQCCANTGKCYCVDKKGKKIEGTEKSGQPDCECTFPSFAVFLILQCVNWWVCEWKG